MMTTGNNVDSLFDLSFNTIVKHKCLHSEEVLSDIDVDEQRWFFMLEWIRPKLIPEMADYEFVNIDKDTIRRRYWYHLISAALDSAHGSGGRICYGSMEKIWNMSFWDSNKCMDRMVLSVTEDIPYQLCFSAIESFVVNVCFDYKRLLEYPKLIPAIMSCQSFPRLTSMTFVLHHPSRIVPGGSLFPPLTRTVVEHIITHAPIAKLTIISNDTFKFADQLPQLEVFDAIIALFTPLKREAKGSSESDDENVARNPSSVHDVDLYDMAIAPQIGVLPCGSKHKLLREENEDVQDSRLSKITSINLSRFYSDSLCRVLAHFSDLHELGITGGSFKSKFDLDDDDDQMQAGISAKQYLLKAISREQLVSLKIDFALMGIEPSSTLFLFECLRPGRRTKPMEHLEIYIRPEERLPESFIVPDLDTGCPFIGVRSLHIKISLTTKSASFEALLYILRWDEALEEFSISPNLLSFFPYLENQYTRNFVNIVTVLSNRRKPLKRFICNTHLGVREFDTILTTWKHLVHLQCRIFSDIRRDRYPGLSGEQVVDRNVMQLSWPSIFDNIADHPSLEYLNLSHLFLGEENCLLLLEKIIRNNLDRHERARKLKVINLLGAGLTWPGLDKLCDTFAYYKGPPIFNMLHISFIGEDGKFKVIRRLNALFKYIRVLEQLFP